MAVNLSQIKNLLLPGLYEVSGQYDSIPTEFSKLFKTQKSTMTVESSVQMRFLGLAALKQEGGATTYDNNAGQRYVYNARTQQVGLGFSMTDMALEDNLYKKDFLPTVKALTTSFKEFKEYQAAAIFNDPTTVIAGIGGDGKALAATDHPVDNGTFANTFTVQQQLNETSLIQARTNVRVNFVDEAGLKRKFKTKQLVVHPHNEPTAIRLLQTELRPGTANNDVNVIQKMDGQALECVVWDYLSSNYYWYLTTNVEGLIYFTRTPFATKMQEDFTTDNLMTQGKERYCFSYNDPRALWVSTPSS